MAKHNGCYGCGGGEREVLISIMALIMISRNKQDRMSVALCKECRIAFERDGSIKTSKKETVINL